MFVSAEVFLAGEAPQKYKTLLTCSEAAVKSNLGSHKQEGEAIHFPSLLISTVLASP